MQCLEVLLEFECAEAYGKSFFFFAHLERHCDMFSVENSTIFPVVLINH